MARTGAGQARALAVGVGLAAPSPGPDFVMHATSCCISKCWPGLTHAWPTSPGRRRHYLADQGPRRVHPHPSFLVSLSTTPSSSRYARPARPSRLDMHDLHDLLVSICTTCTTFSSRYARPSRLDMHDLLVSHRRTGVGCVANCLASCLVSAWEYGCELGLSVLFPGSSAAGLWGSPDF